MPFIKSPLMSEYEGTINQHEATADQGRFFLPTGEKGYDSQIIEYPIWETD